MLAPLPKSVKHFRRIRTVSWTPGRFLPVTLQPVKVKVHNPDHGVENHIFFGRGTDEDHGSAKRQLAEDLGGAGGLRMPMPMSREFVEHVERVVLFIVVSKTYVS